METLMHFHDLPALLLIGSLWHQDPPDHVYSVDRIFDWLDGLPWKEPQKSWARVAFVRDPAAQTASHSKDPLD